MYQENNLISNVYKLLVSASSLSENFDRAFTAIRHAFRAKELFFLRVDGWDFTLHPNDSENSLGRNIKLDKALLQELIECAHSHSHGVIIHSYDRPKQYPSIVRFFHKNNIKRLVLVHSSKSTSSSHGILIFVDPRCCLEARKILRKLVDAFIACANNIHYIREIEVSCQTDALTGVFNRTGYNRKLKELRKYRVKKLGCIYVDINALHHINNVYGHERGDRIICYVSEQLKAYFNTSDIFRIGGDEFVVFSESVEKAELTELTEQFKSQLKQCGYFVSAGIQWSENPTNIEKMISSAEKSMYDEKMEFYRTHTETARN